MAITQTGTNYVRRAVTVFKSVLIVTTNNLIFQEHRVTAVFRSTMSQTQVQLPSRVDRKVSNRYDDSWDEYDGEPLFSDSVQERVERRFTEMRDTEYEVISTVKGSSTHKTKIRTKDKETFVQELKDELQSWIDTHGDFLTNIGNARYGEILTPVKVVEISEEKPRKTVPWAHYQAGYHAGVGGADYKKQQIILPIRDFEQWSYHTEVVKPLFEKYHDKYPY